MSNEFELELDLGAPAPKKAEPKPEVKKEEVKPAPAPKAEVKVQEPKEPVAEKKAAVAEKPSAPAPKAEEKPAPAPKVEKVVEATPPPAPKAEEVKVEAKSEPKSFAEDKDPVFEPKKPIFEKLENWLKASEGKAFILKAKLVFTLPLFALLIILVVVFVSAFSSANNEVARLTAEKEALNARKVAFIQTTTIQLTALQTDFDALATGRASLETSINNARRQTPQARRAQFDRDNRFALNFLRNSNARINSMRENITAVRDAVNSLALPVETYEEVVVEEAAE